MVDRVSILGQLELQRNGAPLRIDDPLERAMLGFLALNANRPVEFSRLAERLLPGAAPVTARRRVEHAARRLTALLGGGPSVLLERHAFGSCYLLRAPDDGIDVLEQRTLTGEARTLLDQGDPDRALRALDAALALWRGPLLEGICADGWPESAALHEEYLLLKEDQLGARLAAAESVLDSVVDELQAMTVREPNRETLAELLIDALGRQGRYAEAEAAYRALASTLGERWGLDPAPELQDRMEHLRAVNAAELTDPVDVSVVCVFRPVDDDAAAMARLCRQITGQGGVVVWRIARVLMAVFVGTGRHHRAVQAAASAMRDRLAMGLPETRITVASGRADGYRPENAATAGATGRVLWGRLLVTTQETFLSTPPGTVVVDCDTWAATRHRHSYRQAGSDMPEMVMEESRRTRTENGRPDIRPSHAGDGEAAATVVI